MFILILSLVVINLVLIDYALIKVSKNTKKQLNVIGELNLTDLDEEFWED